MKTNKPITKVISLSNNENNISLVDKANRCIHEIYLLSKINRSEVDFCNYTRAYCGGYEYLPKSNDIKERLFFLNDLLISNKDIALIFNDGVCNITLSISDDKNFIINNTEVKTTLNQKYLVKIGKRSINTSLKNKPFDWFYKYVDGNEIYVFEEKPSFRHYANSFILEYFPLNNKVS